MPTAKDRTDYQQTYYERNRDRLREYHRQKYYKTHPDAVPHGVSRAKTKDPRKVMLDRVKKRVVEKGMDLDITHEDIRIPSHCPILGIPLYRVKGKTHYGTPSLDRILPTKGYVKGNVWVISHRANVLKNNATLDEARAIVRCLEAIDRRIKGSP